MHGLTRYNLSPRYIAVLGSQLPIPKPAGRSLSLHPASFALPHKCLIQLQANLQMYGLPHGSPMLWKR